MRKPLPPPHADSLSRALDSGRSTQALGATCCLAVSVKRTAQTADLLAQLLAPSCDSPPQHLVDAEQRMFPGATSVGGGGLQPLPQITLSPISWSPRLWLWPYLGGGRGLLKKLLK